MIYVGRGGGGVVGHCGSHLEDLIYASSNLFSLIPCLCNGQASTFIGAIPVCVQHF